MLGATEIPGGDYRFDVTTVSGDVFSVNTGIVRETIFRGFASSDTSNDIVSVLITPLEVPGGEAPVAGFDNVSRGVITSAIPEPSTLVLVIAGVLVLLAYTHWQRRAISSTS